MERFAWICFAGAAGTGTRYLIGLWAAQRLGTAFPYGTLLVNVGGCFVMGAVMQAALTQSWPAATREAITIGFLGGLTTYSAFNFETSRLIETGAYAGAFANGAATILGSFAAGLLGMWVARLLLGR